MNSTAIDIGVYNTPFAFGKHSDKFKKFISRDGKKIMQQSFNIQNKAIQCKLNKYIIQNLFNVTIKDMAQDKQRLAGPTRQHLKNIFRLLDYGYTVHEAIIENIRSNSGNQII